MLGFDPRWLRFAPLTSAGLVLAAGVLGVGSQVLDGLGVFDEPRADDAIDEPSSAGRLLVAAGRCWSRSRWSSASRPCGYLVTNWGFTLTHTDADGSWHLRRGLLTTRETSLDDDRVARRRDRRAARSAAGRRRPAVARSSPASTASRPAARPCVPPAPRARGRRGRRPRCSARTSRCTAPLTDHGPRARTRRYTRALRARPWSSLARRPGRARRRRPLAPGRWLLAAAPRWPRSPCARRPGPLARPRPGRRATSSPARAACTAGARCSRPDAVIGWNLRSTWFQRRAGLTTLVATTAGGRQSVTAPRRTRGRRASASRRRRTRAAGRAVRRRDPAPVTRTLPRAASTRNLTWL